ncbi:MAG TPA: hypothetical protein DCW59_05625, partial [Alteromonas sp.]|nr:hypothetical protein [Alteromonas sp.]
WMRIQSMRTWVTNNRNASGISQYEERHAMDGVAGMNHRDVCYFNRRRLRQGTINIFIYWLL